MDFNLDKIRDYMDLYQITSTANRVKNAIYNYSYYEIKVREATSNEKWGPSSTLMQEIAQATHEPMHFDKVMDTIYSRINDRRGHRWRQIHKTLLLIDYLIKCGSEKVIDNLRFNISRVKILSSFTSHDTNSVDHSEIVRKRANSVLELLQDTSLIRAERKKFMQNKNKYVGLSSTSLKIPPHCIYTSNFGNNTTEPSKGYKDEDGPDTEDAKPRAAPSRSNRMDPIRPISTLGTAPGAQHLGNAASNAPSLLIDVDDEPAEESGRNPKEESDSGSWGEFVDSRQNTSGPKAHPKLSSASAPSLNQHRATPPSKPSFTVEFPSYQSSPVEKSAPALTPKIVTPPPKPQKDVQSNNWDDVFGSIVGKELDTLDNLSTSSHGRLNVADEIPENPWKG